MCKVLKPDRTDETFRSDLVPPDPLLTPNKKRTADLLKRFAPRDMVALLKGLEDEITMCECNLREELEKRRKYRIDASRRTHNYQEFITTFILMLAEQGKLPDLLEKALSAGSALSSENGAEQQPESPSAVFFEELLSMNLETTRRNLNENVQTEPCQSSKTSMSHGLSELMTNYVADAEPEPQVRIANGNMKD